MPLPDPFLPDPPTQRNFEALDSRFPVGPDAISSLPSARVYNSAALTIATGGVGTSLTFDSERFDTRSLHSTSANTGRLTAPVAGLYVITAQIEWAANGVGERDLILNLNGTTNIARSLHPTTAVGTTAQSISTLYKLAANDYVQVVVRQTSGGNLNVTASGNYSPEFSMSWLHPAT